MPIQLPIGSEAALKGIVDLVRMKAVVWDNDGLGANYHDEEIPADMKDRGEEARHYMIENAVELDDEAMEAYLERRRALGRRLKKCIRKAVLTGAFYPILCGSAFKNKGVQPLLDAVVDYLPSPVDIPPTPGIDFKTEEPVVRQRLRRRAAVGPGVQDHGRPLRGLADLLPHLLGQARDRHGPAELDRATRASASAACC